MIMIMYPCGLFRRPFWLRGGGGEGGGKLDLSKIRALGTIRLKTKLLLSY